MRLRLPMLTAAVCAVLAAPSAAQAAEPPAVLPCVDAVVVAVGCERPAPAPGPPAAERCPGRDLLPDARNLAAVRGAATCLVNEERAERGLPKLRSVPALQSVASAYARRMVRERFFSHTSPDGGTFLTRVKRTTYLRGTIRRWSLGENLAWGTAELATAEEVVGSWMRSPGHRRNILSRSFTEFGMGVASGAPRAGAGGGRSATFVNEFGERRR